jgi:N-acyl-L-homoserine lactone synthetase
MQGKSLIRRGAGVRNVCPVFSSGPPERCYLVEWYRPALLAQPIDDAVARLDDAASAEDAPVRLLMTMAAVTDEVLYSLFTAESAESVQRVCRRAGWPADRITDRIDARIAGAPC